MACLDAYATPADYATWWGNYQHKIDLGDMTPDQLDMLQSQLKMTAGQINLTLQQVGACDCTISDAGLAFLKQLNCILTAIGAKVSCGPRISDEERSLWLEWCDGQLLSIREGKLELCDGYTSADYPAVGHAEVGWTEDISLRIIENRIKRGS